jgi:hypothetical protein
MRKSLLMPIAAFGLAASFGVAVAQTSTTTTTTRTFGPEHGTIIREYSQTRNYSSFNDPSVQTSVGVVLPGTVTLHPLPDSIKVPQADTYSYSIVNNRPVVVERSSRKVIHTWE